MTDITRAFLLASMEETTHDKEIYKEEEECGHEQSTQLEQDKDRDDTDENELP